MMLAVVLSAVLASFTVANEAALPPPKPSEIQSKFFSHYVMDSRTLLLGRKIFLYKDELYSPWSEWGNCTTRDCTELRYRACLNDSYENWIPNLFRTNNCPFQYIAESRRCRNDTQCHQTCKF